MILIIGACTVIGCVLLGFILSGGHVGALIHPAELLTIGGASMGALIMMSPLKVIKDLVHGVLSAVKGSPFNKNSYKELFTVSYLLLRAARRDGLLALESHISEPKDSAIFNKCPKIAHNHHVMDFLRGGIGPLVENVVGPEDVHKLLEMELRAIEAEHHAPIDVLQKTADGLPGFGIVAAVLGIVITMGAIDGPVEEVGHKVGAALVGTFLGILLSYGFFGPLAARMEFLSHEEMAFFRTMTTLIMSMADDASPKVALESARRGVPSEFRPNRDELEAWIKQAEAA